MRQKVDFIQQTVMTSLAVAIKRNSKAKLSPKKDNGCGLVVCCWSDPLPLSESWWNHYIWEVCSVHQLDAPKSAIFGARTGQQKEPNSPRQCLTTHRTTSTSEVERIGLQNFASSAVFTWSLANWLPLLQASQQLFAGKTLSQPAGGRKCFQIACWIDSRIFTP